MHYFIKRSGKVHGPFSREKLIEHARTKRVFSSDLVGTQNSGPFVELKNVWPGIVDTGNNASLGKEQIEQHVETGNPRSIWKKVYEGEVEFRQLILKYPQLEKQRLKKDLNCWTKYFEGELEIDELCDNVSHLDIDLVRELLIEKPDSETYCLSCTTADDEAICLLCSSKPNASLYLGLLECSDAVAESLVRHDGEVCISNIQRLGSASVHYDLLRKHVSNRKYELNLKNLRKVDQATASIIKHFRGALRLNRVQDLSVEAARELMEHGLLDSEQILDLSGLRDISIPVAKLLTSYQGELHVYSIRYAKPEVWKIFWESENNIQLNRESEGEWTIARFLEMQGITFEREKSFAGLKDKASLKFDFFLPEFNVLIEFDGRQHFEFVPKLHGHENKGGKVAFELQQKRDLMKNAWAEENSITLVRIRYDEDVYKRLEELFGDRYADVKKDRIGELTRLRVKQKLLMTDTRPNEITTDVVIDNEMDYKPIVLLVIVGSVLLVLGIVILSILYNFLKPIFDFLS